MTVSKKPSAQLLSLLQGKISYDDAPESIKSWASFYFYEAAEQILKIKSKEERRKALQNIPETIRPHVEREVLRVWSYYKSLNK